MDSSHHESFNGYWYELGIPARLKRDAKAEEDFWSFINKFRGLNLYTTVYGFKEPTKYDTAIIDKLFFEFDGENKIFDERLLNDVRCFLRFLQGRTDSKPQIFYSGNSGFHVVLWFKPVTLYNPHRAIQRLIQNLQSLSGSQYLDLNANNGLSQMRRIPNSMHQKTKLYAIPLKPEEVLFYSVEEIKDLARAPRTVEAYWNHSRDIPMALERIDFDLERRKLLKGLLPTPPVREFNLEACNAFKEVQKGVPVGQRDNALVGLVYALRGKGFSKEEASVWCKNWHKVNEGQEDRDDAWIDYKVNYHYNREKSSSPCYWFKKAGFNCSC